MSAALYIDSDQSVGDAPRHDAPSSYVSIEPWNHAQEAVTAEEQLHMIDEYDCPKAESQSSSKESV